AFDWEWSAASKTITIIPEASPDAEYAIVGQYKDGKMVSVFIFDLNDEEQTAKLKDPDSNKNKLFLLDDEYNPID
ncbi:MAG: hypothetical protein IKZ01_05340, partial [Anaerotignum sp.]|nr:hypothetical protein [Anaerotignum sp.]